MPGPPPDPNAKRGNLDGVFTRVVRDADREIPDFPEHLENAIPVDCWDIANAYWEENWRTYGDQLEPIDVIPLARATILHVQLIELGAEATSSLWNVLMRMETKLGIGGPEDRRRLRRLIVPKDPVATQQAGLHVVPEDIAARANRAG